MEVTRGGFSQIVANAFAGMGFPAEAPTVYEFPIEMFDQGSDLTPINENIDKIVYGLTKWEPKIKEKGVITPEKVVVEGKDYPEAVDNMNALFVKNLWSDGLPLIPATEERVNWILTGTDLSADTVIAKTVLPRGGIADVQSIAVALAMTNGRPEYLPVLIAIVEAITEPAFGLQALNSTTCSVIPAVIVNGPIVRPIRLGSGYGLLGPDPVHPAGQIIGRALRIIQQNLGGAIPGIGTMAIYGGFRATNAVFAEDEEGLPEGWPSLAEERGFKREQNVVTATPVASETNILWGFGTKEANDETLLRTALIMAAPNRNLQIAWRNKDNPDIATGVVLFPRGFVASLAEVSGYSKMDVKTFLWNNSKIPVEGEDTPITLKPEQIMLVVAGGDQSGHGYWMQVGHSGYTNVSKEIKLPKNWDDLLKQNVADLGPPPAVH